MTKHYENTSKEPVNWKDYLLRGDQEAVREKVAKEFGRKVYKSQINYYALRLEKNPTTIEGRIIKAALLKIAKANKERLGLIEAA